MVANGTDCPKWQDTCDDKDHSVWIPLYFLKSIGGLAPNPAGMVPWGHSYTWTCKHKILQRHPNWIVRTESRIAPEELDKHWRLPCTSGIRWTGHKLPILVIWRVPGQPHICCSCLGIYLLLLPWYRKIFDLITHSFHLWCFLLFCFVFLEDSKHHLVHLAYYSSAILLAHYFNSFPQES